MSFNMRCAVFTSRFPSRVSTFFARDMRALLETGIKLDVFPMHPIEPQLWRYVPDILNEHILDRRRVRHLTLWQSLRLAGGKPHLTFHRFARDVAQITTSAARFGASPVIKSAFVCFKARAWAQQDLDKYDHVLAYWGNYAATCAYVYHRHQELPIPFSMFLHAGTDLYRNQVYMRQKLLYADNIIVVCEFNRQFIRDTFADIFPSIAKKIHVYHPGLDFAYFPYRSAGRELRTVLAAGNFDKRKGFDYLLRATHELKRRGIDIRVELVGDGEEKRALKALVNKLQIADMVNFRGWLSPQEVQTAMSRATMLVHPSTGLGDAVPTVIKEAMALGTPVVATKVAGIPELLNYGACGVLVPPKDVEALAQGIDMLVTSPARRLQYAEAAREYAEQTFDLWRNGQRLGQILASSRRSSSQGVSV